MEMKMVIRVVIVNTDEAVEAEREAERRLIIDKSMEVKKLLAHIKELERKLSWLDSFAKGTNGMIKKATKEGVIKID